MMPAGEGAGMTYRSAAALLALALAGCAANSGVAPDGQGGYMIQKQAATGFPGPGSIKADVMREANDYCVAQGREFLLTNVIETQPPFVLGNYPRAEINFKCVPPGAASPTR
jgi:hypothetical protein